MPFFSKRKQGKQKVSKHGPAHESKTQTNTSQKRRHQEVGARQSFNGVPSTPDAPRKDLFKACQRPPNSTAKCVANFPRRSRLSKSLLEVLVDDSILPQFLEFLQKQGAQNVLNFWLAVETFRLSSERDKHLFTYKSRLKIQPDEGFSGNMAMFNVPSGSRHMVSPCPTESKYSSEMNLTNQQASQNLSTPRVSSSTCKNDDSYYSSIPGNLAQTFTNEAESIQPHTSQTSPYQKTENTSQCDSSNQNTGDNASGNHFKDNTMHSSITLSMLKESLDNSTAAVNTGHNLSPVSSSRTDKLEISKNANQILSKRTENLDDEFLTEFQMDFTRENMNDPLSRHESDSSPDKATQESTGIRQQRQMSKIMMDDALSIYRHFISLDATQPLGVDESIRREVESNICTETGVIDPDCFKVAQMFAFDTLQNRYFDEFLRSPYYQKHIMDILTSGKVFLADIMYNDSAMFYFMEFMEQEGKSYLLAFWFAVDSFCQELQSRLDTKEYNGDEALADAMVLYDKYFSMQATNSLGVSDETRIRIENKICREGGPLPECFEEPMENVLTLLEEVYFPIFLDSSVYFKYLNELFSSVTDADSDQTSTYADDCSSTASGNETSKLMESLVNDVETHEDPDEIWQRPNFGLSIGRVNEFGIYEPGMEPQPGREALKFGQKMKKLVSGDSDKVKEEMAWKVAKMVLEDVKKQQGKSAR